MTYPVSIELADLAVVEIHDLVGEAGEGGGVGRQIVAILADADDERAAKPRPDDHAGLLLAGRREPVGPLHDGERLRDGREQDRPGTSGR